MPKKHIEAEQHSSTVELIDTLKASSPKQRVHPLARSEAASEEEDKYVIRRIGEHTAPAEDFAPRCEVLPSFPSLLSGVLF